ncbi:MAG: ornithine cyclodeaminase family protein [Actinobacteria bacterium]|nr:ornithine cyclodeaminase family protein [Actinomycetota bacterium]
MASLRLIDHDAVLAAVSPEQAIERVTEGFKRFACGDWVMPSKVYLDAPPGGDFRAMPARGDGLAIVKWVTSFPGNSAHGMPVVYGTIIVSSAESGEPLALIDGRAVTALRTGAVAPIATRAIAPEGARSVGIIGCGLHGAWVARCMAAAGYGDGVVFDATESLAASLAAEFGWRAGTRAEAAGQDVVCTITPGSEPVVTAADLRPGQHINALGADGPGKSELTPEALDSCLLFCDEWEQASHGGEITGAVARGVVARGDVTELGWLLTGVSSMRRDDKPTLFDSTGLAIQDLAICTALMAKLAAGEIDARSVDL